jgi:hypothetical protein
MASALTLWFGVDRVAMLQGHISAGAGGGVLRSRSWFHLGVMPPTELPLNASGQDCTGCSTNAEGY